MNSNYITAKETGLISCHICEKVSDENTGRCSLCHSKLHVRKPSSLGNSGAYLITAAGLYIPAMILPVSTVTTLGVAETTTLMGSVVSFAQSGAIPVAVVIFIASVVVPLFKLLGLGFLLITVNSNSTRDPLLKAKLYRFIEFVGRWSMVDVFVIALLVALVQLGIVANIKPELGIVAFAGVVVLTIFASNSFDPRLIWDAVQENRS